MTNLKNLSRKQLMLLGFSAFYLISILLTIAVVFGLKRSSPPIPAGYPASYDADDHRTLGQYIALQKKMNDVVISDQNYAFVLADSNERSNLPAARVYISNAENRLNTALDSVEFENSKQNQVITQNTDPSVASVTSFYRKLLENRKVLSTLKGDLTAGSHSMKLDSSTRLNYASEITKKDTKIAMLESALKETQRDFTKTTPLFTEQPEIDSLKRLLTEQKNTTEDLKGTVTKIKADNESLSSDLKQARKNDNSHPLFAAKEPTTAVLQKRIDDLTAALNFEEIDCNLSRADAKQIIYTAKQRMTLLSGALKSLAVLARSDNPEIQKKAKEKQGQLQQIASTLRD